MKAENFHNYINHNNTLIMKLRNNSPDIQRKNYIDFYIIRVTGCRVLGNQFDES